MDCGIVYYSLSLQVLPSAKLVTDTRCVCIEIIHAVCLPRLLVGTFLIKANTICYVTALDPYTVITKSAPIVDALKGSTFEIRCDVNNRPDGIAVCILCG